MMAAVVLLAVWCVALSAEGDTVAQGRTTVKRCTEQIHTGVQEMTDRDISDVMLLKEMAARADECPDSITAVRTTLDAAAAREQHTLCILIRHFLTKMLLLALFVQFICGILMRRYGYRMIDVWENIYYIHLVDGKKDARFWKCDIRGLCN